ncbi:MAG: corrinoid protein-associated methyltransferase CpaM [Candidatus Aminicenantia bacterium]
MKILESVPKRYDLGITLLSLGKVNKIKEKIANEFIRKEDKVLEIGCGTGSLSVIMAEKGAEVYGFDISKSMLQVAKKKVSAKALQNKIKLREMSVAEMDTEFPNESLDKIVSILVFSELSRDEQTFALHEAFRILRNNGLLILADEVLPKSLIKKIIYWLLRLPLLTITYLITQTTTKPVKGLKDRIITAGFKIVSIERNFLESFETIIAKK